MAPTYITITGTFDDGQGNPLTGTATFTPSATVYFAGVPQVTAGVPVQAVITSAGLLKNTSGGPLLLLATDSTGQAIEGLTGFWFWTAAWTFTAGGGQSFSFSLPKATSSPADLLSLANTPAGGGFTSPLTTLGDTMYENATPAAARLPGNTSATKNFLTQTGTGTVSAAPAWGTIAVADLASAFAVTFTFGSSGAAPSSGTYTTGQVVTDQNGVVRVCTAGGTPGTWTRAGQKPWEFYADDYGALGNGRVIGDGVINGTTTFTSASAGFTSADTGKTIMINGALGATTTPLITTITFVNATTVTLASGATATATGCSAIYGTDDTTAVNNAVTAAKTYALASNFKFQILLGAKNYCLASGPTQSGNGSSTPTFNSQIPLPFPNANGTTQKLVTEFAGTGDAAQCQYFQSTIPNLQGTCLVSMVLAPTTGGSATFGVQSVIGGPSAGNASGAFGFTGGFANVLPVISGITVVVPWGAQQTGFDFRFVSGMSVPNASVQAFAPVLGTSPLQTDITHWANVNAQGLYAPITLNNDDVYVGQFTAEGIPGVGVVGAEHFTAHKLTLISCNQGIGFRPGGGAAVHGATILSASVENTHTTLIVFNSFGGALYPVNIGLLDTEVIDTSDINDPGNQLTGVIHWADFERTTLNVTGGANVKIINDRLGPGAWAGAPAAPASGTAQQNTSFRDATVYVSSTVPITAVVVAGVTTGQTAAASTVIPVRVPSGQSYTITAATGTQTTHWVLD